MVFGGLLDPNKKLSDEDKKREGHDIENQIAMLESDLRNFKAQEMNLENQIKKEKKELELMEIELRKKEEERESLNLQIKETDKQIAMLKKKLFQLGR